jgi:hypothetical protein
MAEHEPSIGGSDDWYTPPEMFTALGLVFDLVPPVQGRGTGCRHVASSRRRKTALRAHGADWCS